MCDSTPVTTPPLSPTELAIVSQNCKPSLSKEKPIIQVLDSISYFNVTNSLEIIDVEFRGDQALVKSALLTPPTKTTSRGTEENLAFNLIPTKKCELTEPTDLGFHTKLKLKELTTSDVTMMR